MKIQMLVLASVSAFMIGPPASQTGAQSFAVGSPDGDFGRSEESYSESLPSLKNRLLEPVAYVLGLQAVGMGMLLSMDPRETGFKPVHLRNWADGLKSPPVWDDDSWITNYILHPLWGSETYLRARSARYGPVESFFFSTAASVVWEFGFESWAERPSAQDLLTTSTIGSLLGEARYRARAALLKQNTTWALILLTLVDPLGVLVARTICLVGDILQNVASGHIFGGYPLSTTAVRAASGGRAGVGLSIRL